MLGIIQVWERHLASLNLARVSQKDVEELQPGPEPASQHRQLSVTGNAEGLPVTDGSTEHQ